MVKFGLKLILAFFLIFCYPLAFAQELTKTEIAEKGKGIPVEIKDITPTEVLPNKESEQLKNFVSTYIRQNINDYTNFELIDSENTKTYIEQMRKTESDIYADADKQRFGNFRSGRYFFNYTLSKRGENRYNLTIDFSHIQSGTVLATNTDAFNKEQIQTGTAVGRVLFNVFEQIGFTFTDIQKKKMQLLAFGIADIQAQIDAYNEQMNDLEAMANSSSLVIQNQIKRILVEKQRLEQNIKTQESNNKQEELRKQAEEKQRELQSQQSEELSREIEKLTRETTLAQNNIGQTDNYFVEKYIEDVEMQKALLDGFVRTKLSQISELEKQSKIEIASLQDSVDKKYADKSKYITLYSNGELTAQAKQMIQNRKTETEDRIDKKIQNNIENTINEGLNIENDIIKYIKNNGHKKISYSSLNPEHKNISLIIGEYEARTNRNGQQMGWKATLNFSINSQYPSSVSFYISYKDLTGKNPTDIAKASEEEVDAFENEIQVYDSLFRNNIQYVFATVDVSIKIASAPSDNKIVPKNLTDYSFDADAEDSKYTFEILNCKIQRIVEDGNFTAIKDINMPVTKGNLFPQNGRLYHVWNTKRAYKTLSSKQKAKQNLTQISETSTKYVHKSTSYLNNSASSNNSFCELIIDGGVFFSGTEVADTGAAFNTGAILNLSKRHHLRFEVPFRFNDDFEIGANAKYMFTIFINKNDTLNLQVGAGFGAALNHLEIPTTIRLKYKLIELSYTTAFNFEGYFEDTVMCGLVIPLGGKK